ncbi:hypothetical protein AS4_14720 [Acinetobacter guillouiae]|uniref:hypothetical protein n=1 Tax=Acinetobacter guillouiae TaxID=106649 RepID=UPI0004EF63D5|nr:hypothetical protein [Acinetobacter guillouiae]BAP36412.1 hypothetical protein AS4_14720 [Acinetobacter guillouiae]
MISEDTLFKWTAPSSNIEQERVERMLRQAIDDYEPFKGCSLKIYVKDSYTNNTNVWSDSDVDIAVECIEARYEEVSKTSN